MSETLITFVLPFYNEQDYIGATLASLARQTDRRFALRLVDNASNDGSCNVARAALAGLDDIEAVIVHESKPGKINALKAGFAGVATDLVGTLDADTLYPPEYVSRTLTAFERDARRVAVMALPVSNKSGGKTAQPHKWLQIKIWPNHCHTGGYGQAFRRDAFEQAGGFNSSRWPYVLEDHEIVHRVSQFGRLYYSRDHVCQPSDRRNDRSNCSWNLVERLIYKLLPPATMDWFFYRFLAGRFEKRGLENIALRERTWTDPSD